MPSSGHTRNKYIMLLQKLFATLHLIIKYMYTIIVTIIYFFKERPQTSVKEEIVLITGAGHGIGKELAKKYASEGATVVCWDINKTTNEETVQEIKELGYPKAFGYVCDVGNSKDVEKVAKQVIAEVGCVTILINNAGIAYVKSILETTANQVENTMRVNTLSHFWTIKAFLPGMQSKNRGHIVAICSIAGLYGSRNGSPYCSSKFAVRGLMEALRNELRVDSGNKIVTTVIYPAGVSTGIFKRAITRFACVLPVISPKEAADCIVKAQRQHRLEYSIPIYTSIANDLMRLFPAKAQKLLLDFFDTYITE